MRSLIKVVVVAVSGILLLTLTAGIANSAPSPANDRDSIVIVFKDGHRQSFAMGEVARIDFKAPSVIVYKDGHREKISADIDRIEFGSSEIAMLPGRAHFLGKWEVGEGGNGGTFYIYLDADGNAKKTIGAEHGTWTLVDGEARITWDDGWHDAIRKVGAKHEKLAYEPGKTFDDSPSNVTAARNTEAKPI